MGSSPRVADLIQLLSTQVAAACGLEAASVDMKAPFTALGLDSLAAVRLMNELSAALGRKLSPTLIFDYPTITALAGHLAGAHMQTPRAASAFTTPEDSQPIAIVGLACRFPDSPDAAAFWGLLRAGRNAVSVVPRARRGPGVRYEAHPDPILSSPRAPTENPELELLDLLIRSRRDVTTPHSRQGLDSLVGQHFKQRSEQTPSVRVALAAFVRYHHDRMPLMLDAPVETAKEGTGLDAEL